MVSRLGKKSWSGPSAIGTGGAGFGLQAGAAVTEFVIVLNTKDAVKAFSRGGNVSIGGDLTAAIGPIGRNLSADVLPVAAVYAYSRSQGLFAGVSLQGAVIATRDDANTQYHGHQVTPDENPERQGAGAEVCRQARQGARSILSAHLRCARGRSSAADPRRESARGSAPRGDNR